MTEPQVRRINKIWLDLSDEYEDISTERLLRMTAEKAGSEFEMELDDGHIAGALDPDPAS